MTVIVLIEVQLKQTQSFINIMSIYASKLWGGGGGILKLGIYYSINFTICR